MPAKSQAQQRFFGAIKGGAIPRPAGMSEKTVQDFAATPRRGLPEHLGNGRMPRMPSAFKPTAFKPTPMTNTTFQQDERSFRHPSWLERAPHLADGAAGDGDHWGQKAFAKAGEKGHSLHATLHVPEGQSIPPYRVRAASHSDDPHERHQAQAALNMNKRYYGQ